MKKHFTALGAMLDYLPFLAMLVPTLLLVAAAAISLSPAASRADMPAAMPPMQSACDRVPDSRGPA